MIASARQLFERRVPQFVALYIGLAWGAVQFVNFIEERYALSPRMTDIALLTALLLLPSVILFTYNHGRPGADAWVRSEKIGIPLNLVVAGVVLFIVFGNEELGAVMTEKTVIDETGAEVVRAVPKASFRKRLALFNFDGAAQDTAAAWLRYALPLGVATDLSQDMFLDVRPSVYFRAKLRELGYRDEVNVPISLKRRIAEEAHLPYFTDAQVTGTNGRINVELALHVTMTGDVVRRRSFAGTDVFALIDEISVALKEDLGLPRTDRVKDLPVSEVLTSSAPAFRMYSDATVALTLEDEWQRAAQLMEQATSLDDTFAAAHLTLHNILLLSNQSQKSMLPLQRAMDHLYRLPERVQYDVKAEYFYMKQDIEKAYAAANMKVSLYPEDISGYALLSQFQRLRNDRAGVIASFEKILELDPGQQEMLREIGALHEQNGAFDDAMRYYGQYAERYPARQDASIALARLSHWRGRHGEAKQHYEKALILATGETEAMVGLAAVHRDLGDFDAAERQLNDALDGARTTEQRVRALGAWSDYYEYRGQYGRGIEFAERMRDENAKVQPALIVVTSQLAMLGDYVRAGKADVARRTLAQATPQLQPPFHTFGSLGEMELHIALENADAAAQAADTTEQRIRQFGFQHVTPAVVRGRAQIAELRGDCEQAVRLYEEKSRMDPADFVVLAHAARCYRSLGQPQKAIEYAQRTLAVRPYHGRANYETALAYLDAGNRAKALEHLRRAVQVWRDADASFRMAADARAKLKQLESGG